MGALLVAALLSAGAPLQALLDRVVAEYGGQRLAHIAVIRESGTLETMRGPARTVRLFAPPGRLRVEIQYPQGNGEVRVLDGPRAYRDGAPVDGPPRDAMVLQAARLDLPRLFVHGRAQLLDLGAVERDGRSLRGIGVRLGSGLNLALLIDPASARIVRTEAELPSPGGPVRFATRYDDFRRVDGVLFAFAEENFAGGQQTGRTRLETIELLAAAPEGAFSP